MVPARLPPTATFISGEGVVLRTLPYSDADIIARIFSPELGKIACIVKGGRSGKKTFGAPLDLFDVVRMKLREPAQGGLWKLAESVPQRSFVRLRENLDVLSLSALLAETLDHLTIEDNAESSELYHAVLSALTQLNDGGELKDLLRTTTETMVAFLELTGHLDKRTVGAPSPKTLRYLISATERVSERRSETKGSIEELLRRLAEEHTVRTID